MSELIKKYEGLRLNAYKCPSGVWTIGYGNTTYPNGEKVRDGDCITLEQADAYLNDYLIKEVDPYIAKVTIPITLNQKDALASLIYNWNGQGFVNSKLFKAINAKDWGEVCRQWDFGFKNGLKGLYKRRTEELYLFMTGI